MYQYPGLSPDLDLVVPNQFQLTYGRRFRNGCTKIPLSAGGGSGGRGHSFRRRLRPCFTFGSSCLDLPDLIRSRKIRVPSYDFHQAALVCRTIDQDPVDRVLPQGDEQLSRHCHDR